MRALLGGLVAVLVLAGCTGVPESSAPQIVKPVPVEGPIAAPAQPPASADARAIVQFFLDYNAVDEPNHASARQALTAEARSRWSDSTVTVVDRTQVQNFTPGPPVRQRQRRRTGAVLVTGRPLGTIDENGVYTPSLRGDGTGQGAISVTQSFGVVQVGGQWRISTVPRGLLITAAAFAAFRQYPLYFLDSSENHLVPQPRYTQLTGTADVVPWLIDQLAQVPATAQLQSDLAVQGGRPVSTTVPPDPSDPSTPITVSVPGASGLDAANLNRLGAQIAATLLAVPQIDRVQITDAGRAVRIPAAGHSSFTTDQLAALMQPAAQPSQLYFVRNGGVVDESGQRLPGKVGMAVYHLDAVALTRRTPTGALLVAGIRGTPGKETLNISDPKARGGLIATKVHGELSRPSWAPGRNEVWIGAGRNLERVTGPRSVHAVPLDVAGGKANARVAAVRVSPDGTRVALVLASADGSQIYVGTIVRTAGRVGVDGLQAISPQGVEMRDVAWNDQLKLFGVGHDATTNEDGVYEVQCDGSLWTPRDDTGLPGPADSVTATAFSLAVVSTGNSVWQQQTTGWVGLIGGVQTLGRNPVYLE